MNSVLNNTHKRTMKDRIANAFYSCTNRSVDQYPTFMPIVDATINEYTVAILGEEVDKTTEVANKTNNTMTKEQLNEEIRSTTGYMCHKYLTDDEYEYKLFSLTKAIEIYIDGLSTKEVSNTPVTKTNAISSNDLLVKVHNLFVEWSNNKATLTETKDKVKGVIVDYFNKTNNEVNTQTVTKTNSLRESCKEINSSMSIERIAFNLGYNSRLLEETSDKTGL